ncbi:MAG: cbb3-type cytochrome oxidase assembly protein CcoS [Aeromonas sp.]
MNIIFVLIPIAMLFVILAGGIFFWAIRAEQFEDLDRQGATILFDEEFDKPVDNECNTALDKHVPSTLPTKLGSDDTHA